jgi:mycoredoxin
VRLYWRPGCLYCTRLRGRLRQIGLPVTEINIWDDESAAATVRSVADGNETVPVVLIGDVALVNPGAAAVMDAVRAGAQWLLAGIDQEAAAQAAPGRRWVPRSPRLWRLRPGSSWRTRTRMSPINWHRCW